MPLPKNKESRLAMWKKKTILFLPQKTAFFGTTWVVWFFRGIPREIFQLISEWWGRFSNLAWKLRIPNDFHIFSGGGTHPSSLHHDIPIQETP